jgi:segregation and condensation protein A
MEEETKPAEQIGHEQLFDLLTSKEVSWQAIIYDLINSEQLDPWNVDISYLAQRYLEKIKELEEANFVVSSKVLLAASILLRMKSEILLNDYLRGIDEILFGKKEEPKKVQERIIIDESELPFLYPKTPLPRFRKISINELMQALERAVNTETRRIRKEVTRKQLERDADIVLPKFKISIQDRIRKVYSRIITAFNHKKTKVSYSELTGKDREEKLACFLPMLHLTNQEKLFLEQEKHFDEIWIWLYHHYRKEHPVEKIVEMIDEKSEDLHKETGFDNPIGELFDEIEKNHENSAE